MKENNTYYDNMEGNNLPDSLRVTPFIVPDNYFNEQTNRLLFLAKLDSTSKDQRAGFEVPESYFDELSEQIMSQVKIDQFQQHEGFEVPAGYFADLNDRIMQHVQIDQLQEEQFTVPEGYFTNLSDSIMAKVSEDNLQEQVKESGFEIPDQYFETSTDQIMASIAVDDLKSKVQTDGFSVPMGYFDKLTKSILDEVEDKKVIQMPQPTPTTGRKKSRPVIWIGAAAAACVAAFVGVSTYNSDPNNVNSAATVANAQQVSLDEIPEDEIISYLASHSDGTDLAYYAEYIYEPEESAAIGSQIDDKDLEEYLNYNTL